MGTGKNCGVNIKFRKMLYFSEKSSDFEKTTDCFGKKLYFFIKIFRRENELPSKLYFYTCNNIVASLKKISTNAHYNFE